MKTFEQLRIVFFGTPDFAVGCLKGLVDAGADIVAVVTMPDKPAGRGQQLQASAVKQYAIAHGIPVLQPEKMKAPEFLEALKALNADLQVVVAFRMMPEVVWNMPPMGTINVHGSLLPQYRGAAPINWAIINGEMETGVTTFKLKHEIDTGDILLRQSVPITADDNAGTMHDKLMAAGAELLVRTVKGLADGTLQEVPQSSIPASELKSAPKIFKENLAIDWNKTVAEIDRFIRGVSPEYGAYTFLSGKQLKIYKSHFLNCSPGVIPGTYNIDNKELKFAAKDGWLYVDELKLEGKKQMITHDFLRGFRISEMQMLQLTLTQYHQLCNQIGISKGNYFTYAQCVHDYYRYINEMVLPHLKSNPNADVIFFIMESIPQKVSNSIFNKDYKIDNRKDAYLSRILRGFGLMPNGEKKGKYLKELLSYTSEDKINRPIILLDALPFHGIQLLTIKRKQLGKLIHEETFASLLFHDLNIINELVNKHGKYVIYGCPPNTFESLHSYIDMTIFKTVLNKLKVINVVTQNISSVAIRNWRKSENI